MPPRTGRFVLSARALERLLGEWDTGGPAYRRLADRLRVLIIDGRIAVGTWLPAERELADQLGRSRTTVISAYAALRGSGHLESVRGAGSRVKLANPADGLRGFEPDGPIDLSKAAVPIWPGLPEVFQEVAAGFSPMDAGTGLDLIGDVRLREAIAAAHTAEGLPTTPDQIMVTVGAQHAISLLAGALLDRGDRVVVETPTYPHAVEAFRDAGARIVTVRVTDEGWDLAGLADTLERSRPALVYVIPDFQNPTAASMDGATRAAVAALVERSRAYLVVDETTRSVALDGQATPPPLAAEPAAGDLTITLGSMGKTVWHGLRIGWLRADRSIVARVAMYRAARDLGTPRLDQLVALRALERMPEIIADRADRMRAGRDLIRELLTEHLPEWELPPAPGGVSYWVNLGVPASSQLALAARARGVVITPGPRFGVDGEHERRLRLPFTSPAGDLEAGIPLLAEAWRAMDLDAPPAPIELGRLV